LRTKSLMRSSTSVGGNGNETAKAFAGGAQKESGKEEKLEEEGSLLTGEANVRRGAGQLLSAAQGGRRGENIVKGKVELEGSPMGSD